jgi:hypothetical protein
MKQFHKKALKTTSEKTEELTKQLCTIITSLPLEERVQTLNAVRAELHDVSPFKSEPVDFVAWVKNDTVRANDYNPNAVAPPEMELLRLSIEADGYTQPIVAHRTDDGELIVDGFHRHRVGKEVAAVRERVYGYLPVTRVNEDRTGIDARITATIRHNRARGEHSVSGMVNVVRMLHVAGWPTEKIEKELGMSADEVLRLKQITGLRALFSERKFSDAWEPVQSGSSRNPLARSGERMPEEVIEE